MSGKVLGADAEDALTRPRGDRLMVYGVKPAIFHLETTLLSSITLVNFLLASLYWSKKD